MKRFIVSRDEFGTPCVRDTRSHTVDSYHPDTLNAYARAGQLNRDTPIS